MVTTVFISYVVRSMFALRISFTLFVRFDLQTLLYFSPDVEFEPWTS